MPVDYRLSTFAIALIAGRCKYVRTVIDNDILRFAGFFQRFVCVGIIMNMRPLGFDVRLRSSTSFGDIGQRMPSTQCDASLFLAEIPNDIGQLAANPDLGQMLIHEESLAFDITGDEVSPVIKLCVEHLHGFRIEQHREDGRCYGSLIAKSLVVVKPVNGVRVLRVVFRGGRGLVVLAAEILHYLVDLRLSISSRERADE